jgi:aspartate carbamoyltransferase catalytic subunit
VKFPGRHILSIGEFTREEVERIFDVADCMEPYAHRRRVTKVLDGAILGSMFFEPSTRTRVSFGCAFNLLGGEVRETTGFESSSLSKGESLRDTARVLSGYSDVIVMRHPQAGSVAEFAAASRVPVINGGDGPNEHPSQALLDLYTIRKEMRQQGRNSIDGLSIGMIGDLKYGRTVHSLCKLLKLFKNVRVTLISPHELRMPPEIVEQLRAAGHTVIESTDMEHSLSVDIAYATRIQEERFASLEDALMYRGRYRLNKRVYTQFCKPNTVIMHPLPRDSRAEANELSDDLDDNPNLAIFRQADNGVLVRMALFALILDVADQVDRHARDVNWYTERRF